MGSSPTTLQWHEFDAGHVRSHLIEYGPDDRGRMVGGIAYIWQIPRAFGYRPETEGKFCLTVRATRNGANFGATPHSTLYDTLEEAQAAAPAKLQAQQARYARKFGWEAA